MAFIPTESLSARMGTGLGQGIASGLEQLAQQKLQQRMMAQQRQQTTQGLQALGIDQDQASQLSGLPEPLLQAYLKQHLAAPQQEAFASALGNLLGQPQEQQFEQPQQEMMPQQEQVPLTQMTEQKIKQLKKYIGSRQASKDMDPFQLATLQNKVMEEEQKLKEAPLAQKIEKPYKTKETVQPKRKPALNERQALELAKLGVQLRKEEKESAHKEKIISQKEQLAVNKENKQFYDAVLKSEDAAKQGDLRLNRMEKLIDRGGLPTAAMYNLFKNLEEKISPASGAAAGAIVGGALGGLGGLVAGGPAAVPAGAGGSSLGTIIGGAIGGLASPVASLLRYGQKKLAPNTEEFEKLTADFVRSAKDYFPGGRMTDADLAAFFAMIPTLNQTDAGKRKIIENMRSFNKIAKLKTKAMKDIIKEHGKIPPNLPILVNERIAEESNKIAEEFINR